MKPQPNMSRALAGEVLGTYLLVLFGTGSVASAVLSGAQVGLWQVAAVWGFGVTLAICVSANLSGAHLNPAVSLSMALLRTADFPAHRLDTRNGSSQAAPGIVVSARTSNPTGFHGHPVAAGALHSIPAWCLAIGRSNSLPSPGGCSPGFSPTG